MDPAMTGQTPDRRRVRRRQRVEEHGIARARVRAGETVTIINVSAHGALVETGHRLLPGSAVELHVEGDHRRATVRGRVLRCNVARVRAISMRYRGAILFDGHLPWLVNDEPAGYSLRTSEVRSGRHRGEDATHELL